MALHYNGQHAATVKDNMFVLGDSGRGLWVAKVVLDRATIRLNACIKGARQENS